MRDYYKSEIMRQGLEMRVPQLRSEIFNYLDQGIKLERALNAVMGQSHVPVIIKQQLRKEFA